MSQNSERRAWRVADLQQQPLDITDGIHTRCVAHRRSPDGYVDHVTGATIASFKKIATRCWRSAHFLVV